MGRLDARINARGWVGEEEVGAAGVVTVAVVVVIVVEGVVAEEKALRYRCSEANRAVERAFRNCGAFSKRMSMCPVFGEFNFSCSRGVGGFVVSGASTVVE